MTDHRPRTEEMDAIVKGIHGSQAFKLENAARAVKEAVERRAFEAHIRSLNATTHLGRQQEAVGGQYRTITVERNWQLWQAAIKHEREQCAKVCEEVLKAGDVCKDYEDTHEDGHMDGCNNCAAAIRTRGEA